MLIFNTTYKVATDHYDQWIKWINEHHLPFMLETGKFSQPQIAKVVGSDDDEGTSYSVQFHIENMETLMEWHRHNSSTFRDKCYEEFGSQVIFFTTVLEII